MSTIQCIICEKDLTLFLGLPNLNKSFALSDKSYVCKECAAICRISNPDYARFYNKDSLLARYADITCRLFCVICDRTIHHDQLGYPSTFESLPLSDNNLICRKCADICHINSDTESMKYDKDSILEKYNSMTKTEEDVEKTQEESNDSEETPPSIEASADDVINSLQLKDTKFEQEILLLFKFAKDKKLVVYDWQDLRALAELPLKKSIILETYYLNRSNLEGIIRKIIIAESDGMDITCGRYARSLDDVLVCDLVTLEQYRNRFPTDIEKQYFEKIEAYLLHILRPYHDRGEEWAEVSIFYEGYAEELKNQLGWINEFALSHAFDISVELSYIILNGHEKNDFYTGMIESKIYKMVEKPKNMPHCNIDQLQDLINECEAKKINKTSINLYQRFIDPNYQVSSVSNSSEPDEFLTSKDKGIAFEEYCADLLRKNGFTNVELTKTSGDHGVDILAENMDTSYAIQCKNYSGVVGNFAVQEAYTGKGFYNRDVAVVMTNSTFTAQAIEEAAALHVKLWDGNKIKEMLKD